ncbi:hypothetical protein PL11_005655 [Lentilactobacillus curieae]|uniref:Thioredoxin-like fold domain-containing protein n=1 Tax=Lentilactobacillus curieae TaxID=1138822 RepID=A0A1S6QIM7_9LACO|nr:thioredoxin domain-containing protein [Lentilactobacillus curieae]AQW21453.1 hypothetical protein PL11_005655 [Lentilactobacillus curieae]
MAKFNFDYAPEYALTYGKAKAGKEMTVILNLGCPDSKQWFLDNQADLFKAVDEGTLLLHLKFWNKDKDDLVNGAVADDFVDYSNPEKALEYVRDVFENQEKLNEQNVEQVPEYLETRYGVTDGPHNTDASDKVIEEAVTNDIFKLPTVIIDDQMYFDDTLKPAAELIK